ncbi:DUF6080 domain-containing protein [Frigoriflavimonas asaccharolytica]|uniref:DUF6080 domain-containing protein n=1 Tax=Frigoriflavimonas asaccharolytica TaxID=2735899 RepID=UPI00361A343B
MKSFLVSLLKLIFPSTKLEALIFAFYFVLFGILGRYIALHYFIIFDDRIPWDAYFSFDNRAIVRTGGGFERHPLSNYFFEVIRNISFYFSGGKVNFIFKMVLATCSNLAISLSIVQIFKYLKNIIQLPTWISIVLILFFSLFSTTILLSFTPETYTYSLFFLILFNYYAAQNLKTDKKVDGTALTFAGVFIGGLTITNIVKIYIPILFEKNIFWNWKKNGNAVGRIFISVAVFALLFMYRINFDFLKFLNKSGEQLDKFSKPKIVPLWDMIASWFFGGNILFSRLETRDYHSKIGFKYKALFMDVYTSWLPYIFVVILLILVFWSYFKNFKNKFVQILMISFFVDIAVHCFLKFGLHTSYIYGGHFVYIYPLLLGWLFHAYRKSANVLSLLMVVLILLTGFLLMNNIYRMQEFFLFLEMFYKV